MSTMRTDDFTETEPLDLVDLLFRCDDLPGHYRLRVNRVYEKSYWYAAGRLDQSREHDGIWRNAHPRHSDTFARIRATRERQRLTGERSHTGSMMDDWAEYRGWKGDL